MPLDDDERSVDGNTVSCREDDEFSSQWLKFSSSVSVQRLLERLKFDVEASVLLLL